MRSYLLAGSYAYDNILIHKGQFHTKILPESLNKLNVSFPIDNVVEELGGTAGNIAYNASLLQDNPYLVGCMGLDGGKYKSHLESLGLNADTLTYFDKDNNAKCWLMTDLENNQIIGFNSGVLKYRPHVNFNETPKLWHLSADNPLTTAWLVKNAIQMNKDYFFDPGQVLPVFIEGITNNILEFNDIIKYAKGIFLNEYEAELLLSYAKKSLNKIIQKDQFIVKTLGSKGVELITTTENYFVPVAKANEIVDPTGCGDAFRAGFLNQYIQNKSFKECLEYGTRCHN